MKPSKFNCIFGIGAVAVLLWGGGAAASSDATLTGGQIFETMRENYASLLSYTDEGQITTTMGDTVISTRFTTRLQRPGYYRIQWNQISQSPYSTDDTGPMGAWSSGAGEYMQNGFGVRRQYTGGNAFRNLASTSSGALADVPAIFFDVRASASPNDLIGLDRLPDQKFFNLDCFVVTGQLASGETETFWIGKQDLLIHQIHTLVTPAVLQVALSGCAGQNWQSLTDLHGASSTETCTNIVVNKRFSRTDFIPTFPLYQGNQY